MPHAHCVLFGVGSHRGARPHGRGPLLRDDAALPRQRALHAARGDDAGRCQLPSCDLGSARARGPRDVREHRCTVSNLLGSMSEFVIAQPPTRRDDRDHGLRVVCPVPNPPAHEARVAGALRRARGRVGIRHDGGQHPALRSVGAVAARHGRARPRPVVRGGGARPGHRRARAARERSGRSWSARGCRSASWPATTGCPRRRSRRGAASGSTPATPGSWTSEGWVDLRRPHQGLHPPARREHLVLRGRERGRGARGRRRGGRLRRALGPRRHRGRGHARRRRPPRA